MSIRLLGVDDIRAYLTHMLEVDQDSGQDGIHFASHSADVVPLPLGPSTSSK